MGQAIRHDILSFNAETMTGECGACGSVEMRLKSAGKGRPAAPRCMEALRAIARRRVRVSKPGRPWAKRGAHGLLGDEAREFVRGKACLICGATQDDDRLVVDHCHKRGQIRGVLCVKCNSGLGMFRDNPDYLASAIRYLEATA